MRRDHDVERNSKESRWKWSSEVHAMVAANTGAEGVLLMMI